MNKYYQVGIAFDSRDWKGIYLRLQDVFPEASKNVPMNKFINDNLEPDFYIEERNSYIILKWNAYENWEGSKLDKFFHETALNYDCDYYVIDEDGVICTEFNILCVITYQNIELLTGWQPDLKDSWTIINAFVELLKNKYGYSEKQIYKEINWLSLKLAKPFNIPMLKGVKK